MEEKIKGCKNTQCHNHALNFSDYCGIHSKLEEVNQYFEQISNKIIDNLFIADIKIDNMLLEGVTFDMPRMSTVVFKDTTFENFKMIGLGNCNDVSFDNCKFINCYIENSTFVDTKFNKCSFNDVKFYTTDFQTCIINNTKFRNLSFVQVSLQGVDFENIDGSYLTLFSVFMTSVNILNSILKSSDFLEIDIGNSLFRNVNLSYSSIEQLSHKEGYINFVLCNFYKTYFDDSALMDSLSFFNNVNNEDHSQYLNDLILKKISNFNFKQVNNNDVLYTTVALIELIKRNKKINISFDDIYKYYSNSIESFRMQNKYDEMADVFSSLASIEKELNSKQLPLKRKSNEFEILPKQNDINIVYIVYDNDNYEFDHINRLFKLQNDFFNALKKFDNQTIELISLNRGSLDEGFEYPLKQLILSIMTLDLERNSLKLENDGKVLTNEMLEKIVKNLPKELEIKNIQLLESIETERVKQKAIKQEQHNKNILYEEKIESVKLDNRLKRLNIYKEEVLLKQIYKDINPDYNFEEVLSSENGKKLQESAKALQDEFKIKMIKAKIDIDKQYLG